MQDIFLKVLNSTLSWTGMAEKFLNLQELILKKLYSSAIIIF